MKQAKYSAFTLVELIVVITILAVLATVAFISFQGYTSSSRDSVRLADLKNSQKQLNIYFTQKNYYPEPTNGITIANIGTQGELGKSVTNQLGMSEVSDPLTKQAYFYKISNNKRKYQLLGFLENASQVAFTSFNTASAENNIVYSKGSKLGIILNTDGKTLPESIDLSTGTYDIVFGDDQEDRISNISGEENFTILESAQKGFFHPSLVGHWDMETKTSDGRLKDLSGKQNHGVINDADNSGLANPVGGAMVFDGVDDYIDIPDTNNTLDMVDGGTIIAKVSFIDREGTHPYSIVAKGDRSGLNKNYQLMIRREDGINQYLEFINGEDADQVVGGSWDWPVSVRDDTDLDYQTNYIFAASYGNTTTLYIDGEESYQENVTLNLIPDDYPLRIGNRKYNSPNEHFRGTIDEILIFNASLTSEEISEFYNELQL